MKILESTTLTLEQSLVEIRAALDLYHDNQITPDTLAGLLQNAAKAFTEREGTRGDLEFFDTFEPPLSDKINRVFRTLGTDIYLLARQVDLLRAGLIMMFNILNTEIQTEQGEIARLRGMAEAAALYNSEVGNKVLTWVESFNSNARVVSNTLEMDSGVLHLRRSDAQSFADQVTITIEDGSNGYQGSAWQYNGQSDASGPGRYGDTGLHDDTDDVKDSDPGSWWEYEAAQVTPANIAKYKNVGFKYLQDGQQIVWANGPSGNNLSLVMKFGFSTIQQITEFSFVPYWGPNGEYPPILVERVEISPDGNQWQDLSPKNVTIAKSIDLNSVQKGTLVTTQPRWIFPPTPVQYIKLHIKQADPFLCSVVIVQEMNSKGVPIEKTIPKDTERNMMYDPQTSTGVPRKRVLVPAARWVVGIADITISLQDYEQSGEIVFAPIHYPTPVDRAAISALEVIPDGFDPQTQWITFSVSPNQGVSWFDLSPQEQPYVGVPELIAFNDATPGPFRDATTLYQDTTSPVKSLMAKVSISRPEGDLSSTPLVRGGFRLKTILSQS